MNIVEYACAESSERDVFVKSLCSEKKGLNYFGSKNAGLLAETLRLILDTSATYFIKYGKRMECFYDCFGGGGNVSLALPTGFFNRIVLNDFDKNIYNIYKCVREYPETLCRAMNMIELQDYNESLCYLIRFYKDADGVESVIERINSKLEEKHRFEFKLTAPKQGESREEENKRWRADRERLGEEIIKLIKGTKSLKASTVESLTSKEESTANTKSTKSKETLADKILKELDMKRAEHEDCKKLMGIVKESFKGEDNKHTNRIGLLSLCLVYNSMYIDLEEQELTEEQELLLERKGTDKKCNEEFENVFNAWINILRVTITKEHSLSSHVRATIDNSMLEGMIGGALRSIRNMSEALNSSNIEITNEDYKDLFDEDEQEDEDEQDSSLYYLDSPYHIATIRVEVYKESFDRQLSYEMTCKLVEETMNKYWIKADYDPADEYFIERAKLLEELLELVREYERSGASEDSALAKEIIKRFNNWSSISSKKISKILEVLKRYRIYKNNTEVSLKVEDDFKKLENNKYLLTKSPTIQGTLNNEYVWISNLIKYDLTGWIQGEEE